MSTALIVGGSRGLGWSLAKRLTAEGTAVHVWSRRRPPPQPAVSWTRVDLGAPLDANETPFPEGVDTIFHVAASGRFLRNVEGYDRSEFQHLTMVNLISATTVLVRAIQRLSSGGRYCYVSSLTALLPSGGWCLYGATKAGMDHIARSMRSAASRRGISITIAYPGVLTTDFHGLAGASAPLDSVHPDVVAEHLIQSVTRRDALFVAPIDRELLERDIAPDRAEAMGRDIFPQLGIEQ
jgi:NAD(P)-dependent dehydrogenase (short-subunit alcohol dehydrogenase family)